MTLTRTKAFGSAGHIRFPQRSKLDSFFAGKGVNMDEWGTDRTQEICAALAAATQSGHPTKPS
jgi:hypothetical protein